MKKFKVEKLSRQAQKEILGGKMSTGCPTRSTCIDSFTYGPSHGQCYIISSFGITCSGDVRNGLCCF
jgi:hypothetical protein